MTEPKPRPSDACADDEPCIECGELLGDEWGVTVMKPFTGEGASPIRRLLAYSPLHSRCWWKRHPEAAARDEERENQRRKMDRPRSA